MKVFWPSLFSKKGGAEAFFKKLEGAPPGIPSRKKGPDENSAGQPAGAAKGIKIISLKKSLAKLREEKTIRPKRKEKP